MIPRTPSSTRTDTLFPYTTLYRSRSSEKFRMGLAGINHRFDLGVGQQSLRDDIRRQVWPIGRHRRRDRCHRSEEHTSELQSLMRISYAVFCLKKKKQTKQHKPSTSTQNHHN